MNRFRACLLGTTFLMVLNGCTGSQTAGPESTANQQQGQELPAQTLLQVKMKNDIDTSKVKAGDTFEAVLEEPVALNGKEFLPKGADVKGRIVNAQVAQGQGQASSLTLVLESVSRDGRDLKVQTDQHVYSTPPLQSSPEELKDAANSKRIAKALQNAIVPRDTSIRFALAQPARVGG